MKGALDPITMSAALYTAEEMEAIREQYEDRLREELDRNAVLEARNEELEWKAAAAEAKLREMEALQVERAHSQHLRSSTTPPAFTPYQPRRAVMTSAPRLRATR